MEFKRSIICNEMYRERSKYILSVICMLLIHTNGSFGKCSNMAYSTSKMLCIRSCNSTNFTINTVITLSKENGEGNIIKLSMQFNNKANTSVIVSKNGSSWNVLQGNEFVYILKRHSEFYFLNWRLTGVDELFEVTEGFCPANIASIVLHNSTLERGKPAVIELVHNNHIRYYNHHHQNHK